MVGSLAEKNCKLTGMNSDYTFVVSRGWVQGWVGTWIQSAFRWTHPWVFLQLWFVKPWMINTGAIFQLLSVDIHKKVLISEVQVTETTPQWSQWFVTLQSVWNMQESIRWNITKDDELTQTDFHYLYSISINKTGNMIDLQGKSWVGYIDTNSQPLQRHIMIITWKVKKSCWWQIVWWYKLSNQQYKERWDLIIL